MAIGAITRRWRFSVVAIYILLAAGPATAQRDVGVRPLPGGSGQGFYTDSWAVIVGINRYQHPRVPRLRYAVNDAQAVRQALLAQGFRRDRIITLTDAQATKAAIEGLLGDRLRGQVGANDRLLVFFAGHGKTDRLRSGEEEGYLLPVDGDPDGLFSTAISMTALRQISDRLRAKHILYIVDACYSGYAIYNRSIADDLLEEMVKKPAIQILTAGRQRDEAQERGSHGVFTEVLLRGLQGDAFAGKGWLAVEELGVWVKQRVFAESNKKQLPQYGNLSGEGQFVFLKPGGPPLAAPTPAEPPQPQVTLVPRQEFGSLAITSKVAGVEVWLDDRRLGETRPGADLLVSNLPVGSRRVKASKDGYKAWEREVDVAANVQTDVVIDLERLIESLQAGTIQRRGRDNAEMVYIPAATFTMGDTYGDGDADEKPTHQVALAAFWLDRIEVTNAQFVRFIAAGNTAQGEWRKYASGKDQHPVVAVTWHDAVAYCRWAEKRLPTEAEWEYAARGTDGRKYPWGNAWEDTRARFSGNRGSETTAPVGSYPTGASPFGALDMAGNVWEWVNSLYKPYPYVATDGREGLSASGGRVVRGGSWGYDPGGLRSANRIRGGPADGFYGDVGFRCAQAVR